MKGHKLKNEVGDPLPATTIHNYPIVLFDGVCNFCNSSINYLIRQDKNEKLRFAALQSVAGQELLQQHHIATRSFESFVLIQQGKSFQRSTAALRLLPYLRWYWQWANIFWILPQFIRDAAYNIIARNRYRLFGKREVCMIPTPALKSRFL